MPDDDVQSELVNAARERQDQITAELDWFSTSLIKLSDQWQEEITRLASDPLFERGVSRRIELHYLRSQISSQLERLGFRTLAAKFIDLYDEAELAAVHQLDIAGIKASIKTLIDQDAIRVMKDIDLARIFRASDNVIATLSEGIVLNTLGGLPRAKVIANVESSLGQWKRYTMAYVDTGLASVDRKVHWDSWAKVVERFTYYGPPTVRPFCVQHIGKTYTKQEIDVMDNGTRLMPVSIYCGSWGCRHVWIPYVDTPSRYNE